MKTKNCFSLENKVVLITGGEGRYGRGITHGLAEAKAKVVTASPFLEDGKKIAALLRSEGLDVEAAYVDQANHNSVMEFKKELKDKYGKIDVFVNNAVARPMKRYLDPLEAWQESMRINATGMFDILREMADLIAESGGGSIVNIGSMQGMFGPDFSLYEGTQMDSPPDYHFHKGGMIALTKYLARKLGPLNIRVNCLCPGGLFDNQDSNFAEKYNRKVPLQRMATREDIQGPVVFLASDASSYITGESLLMDGGLHA